MKNYYKLIYSNKSKNIVKYYHKSRRPFKYSFKYFDSPNAVINFCKTCNRDFFYDMKVEVYNDEGNFRYSLNLIDFLGNEHERKKRKTKSYKPRY